ncbi:nuclear transport factor 2 family protein [Dietzia aurantiaca]|uniref:Nuclear transport factor 2 family protein n=1 Tax=Dietzia aurantiaca TaxID=983873 RepID=A0ABV9PSG1_9ACTN
MSDDDNDRRLAKLDELLAIEEIKNLRLAYSAYFDSQDLDGLASIFAEDAVCEFSQEYGGDWVGRETIRANYAAVAEQVGAPYSAIHAVTNPWIELIGENTAKGRWYLIEYLTRQGAMTSGGGHANPLFYLGIYQDEYKKVDGSWLISRVKLEFLWPERTLPG